MDFDAKYHFEILISCRFQNFGSKVRIYCKSHITLRLFLYQTLLIKTLALDSSNEILNYNFIIKLLKTANDLAQLNVHEK
jgi:hypothetical protein